MSLQGGFVVCFVVFWFSLGCFWIKAEKPGKTNTTKESKPMPPWGATNRRKTQKTKTKQSRPVSLMPPMGLDVCVLFDFPDGFLHPTGA